MATPFGSGRPLGGGGSSIGYHDTSSTPYDDSASPSAEESAAVQHDLLASYDSARGSNPFARLLSKGPDVESAGSNHRYSREERVRLRQFESIDYLAPSSRVYRQWLSAQPWGRYWDRWLMMALIGLSIGVIGFFLHFFINALAFGKYHGTRWLLAHTNVFVGWLFNMSYSLALVYASTWLVVNAAPAAAGAGVAEVMAYLNGCFMPKVL